MKIKINLPKPKGVKDTVDAFIKFYNDHEQGVIPVWDFDDISDDAAVTTRRVKEILSYEGLEAQKELKGSDFLDEFVTAVFTMGVEHGRRIYEHYELQNKINECLAQNDKD